MLTITITKQFTIKIEQAGHHRRILNLITFHFKKGFLGDNFGIDHEIDLDLFTKELFFKILYNSEENLFLNTKITKTLDF